MHCTWKIKFLKISLIALSSLSCNYAEAPKAWTVADPIGPFISCYGLDPNSTICANADTIASPIEVHLLSPSMTHHAVLWVPDTSNKLTYQLTHRLWGPTLM